jgi:hypothetical protein
MMRKITNIRAYAQQFCRSGKFRVRAYPIKRYATPKGRRIFSFLRGLKALSPNFAAQRWGDK